MKRNKNLLMMLSLLFGLVSFASAAPDMDLIHVVNESPVIETANYKFIELPHGGRYIHDGERPVLKENSIVRNSDDSYTMQILVRNDKGMSANELNVLIDRAVWNGKYYLHDLGEKQIDLSADDINALLVYVEPTNEEWNKPKSSRPEVGCKEFVRFKRSEQDLQILNEYLRAALQNGQ